jgi:hypothetical protein
MTRLSFSQINKYNQCPRSYRLHYVDRLRERSATAYLAFGTAIDESLNAILKDLQKNKTITCDYKTVFDTNWQKITINKKEHSLPLCTLVGYAKSDFIAELLDSSDIQFLVTKSNELGFEDSLRGITLTSLKELKDQLENEKSQRQYKPFLEPRHALLNLMNWLSMRRKGHLMLEAYIRDILPQIEEVVDIQKQIELNSECGSSIIGYIDAIVKLKNREDYTVLDNKTASQPYAEDAVKTSQQLLLYTYALGYKHAGFAVMLKTIRMNRKKKCVECGFESNSSHKLCNNTTENGKRCNGAWEEEIFPEAATQLVKEEIDEQTQLVVVDNISEINEAIKANVFPKNLSTCKNIYGNPCIYLNYCWKNKTDNLEKVE